ncbi:hypothetical protein F2Q69_00022107 [Brassica cretica]|uniref:Uncharacterized protein n=1 Tax=Brassica cretica TaxID=69181 RepID=A0A8S9QJG6_BRACR|nr:hypothetical protein F2Q69_00022107 [Brassica cretica]
MEEGLEKRCDDIYFLFDVRLSGLDSQAEWLQKEVKAIQGQLASQHQISASINRKRSKSIDSKALETIDKHLVASIDTKSTPDDEQLIHNKMESMHEELDDLSAYAYDKIGWHQFSIKTLQERLQNISNAIQKMDERWTRNDEATRSFIAAWSRMCRDEVDACFPTNLLQDPSRMMITISTVDETSTSIDMLTPATIDAYRCTSIDSHSGQISIKRIRTGVGGGNLQGSLHKEFLDIGQKEVNMAWWQPPLSLDSWKPVQS